MVIIKVCSSNVHITLQRKKVLNHNKRFKTKLNFDAYQLQFKYQNFLYYYQMKHKT